MKSRIKQLQEGVEPDLAARALRTQPGFCFFDSSLVGPGAISLLAWEPEKIVQGTASDWPVLEREIAGRMRAGFDMGFPNGAAIGWVNFDGSFCFGIYEKIHVWLHDCDAWINAPAVADIPPDPKPVFIPFERRIGRKSFLEMVDRAQDYIAAGDIYQVCLAHKSVATFENDAWPFYESLRAVSPAPHSAFLDLGGRQVASASPECFLRMSGTHITTRPIKGTRPRQRDLLLDRQSAYERNAAAISHSAAKGDITPAAFKWWSAAMRETSAG